MLEGRDCYYYKRNISVVIGDADISTSIYQATIAAVKLSKLSLDSVTTLS